GLWKLELRSSNLHAVVKPDVVITEVHANEHSATNHNKAIVPLARVDLALDVPINIPMKKNLINDADRMMSRIISHEPQPDCPTSYAYIVNTSFHMTLHNVSDEVIHSDDTTINFVLQQVDNTILKRLSQN
ncbi:hypothetical protein A2U01_0017869, partial [Trifolium medium]|nr:hypothetical protein [Trifolium medium]